MSKEFVDWMWAYARNHQEPSQAYATAYWASIWYALYNSPQEAVAAAKYALEKYFETKPFMHLQKYGQKPPFQLKVEAFVKALEANPSAVTQAIVRVNPYTKNSGGAQPSLLRRQLRERVFRALPQEFLDGTTRLQVAGYFAHHYQEASEALASFPSDISVKNAAGVWKKADNIAAYAVVSSRLDRRPVARTRVSLNRGRIDGALITISHPRMHKDAYDEIRGPLQDRARALQMSTEFTPRVKNLLTVQLKPTAGRKRGVRN